MTRAIRRVQLFAPVGFALLLAAAAVVMVSAVGGTVEARQPTVPGSAAWVDCTHLTGRAGGLGPAQERNAKIITGVAHARGLGDTAAAIGIAAALAESTLFNYANDGTSTLVGSAEGRQLTAAERAVARESLNYPHEKVGNNLDSIGLFQQRPMSGWGPPDVLIDPASSAGLFFDRLVTVPGWQSIPPWNSAQAVQGSPSSDGGIYRRTYEQAVGIVAALTTGPAGGVPVPAGSAAGGVDDELCAAPAPALRGAGGLSAGGSAQWGGYANGRIPANALCPVPKALGLLLECSAAAAFDRLNSAFVAEFGQDIGITDGYRSFDEQVACRAAKGSLCANPGTSNHGWAKAVDIGGCCGVNSGTGPAFDWLTANAGAHGWIHPPWARAGGSKPEPWHWEYGSIS